jgi:glycosyltransferase involved in cell wall biosynthesis
LAEALSMALREPESRALGEAARAHVAQHYSLEDTAHRLADLYTRLASRTVAR